MADDSMFALLPDAGRAQKTPAPKDPWTPMLPVPSDAPPAPPRHRRHGQPSGCWTYRDAAGELLGYVLRFDRAGGDKEFVPMTYCENAATGAREWRFKGWPAPRPLYGLDRLPQRPSAPVVVCEGEKAVDAAAELLPGHVAVTSPNGAKSAEKTDWRALAGRPVTLWADNDDEGRAYVTAVARALRGIAASVKLASTPIGATAKWDAANALAEGWDQAKTEALIAAAVPLGGDDAPYTDPANDDAEIARLAALPLVAYGRERKPAAERLGCPLEILDRAVAAERGNGGTGAGQGRPLNLSEPEPWPEPVDGGELLDAIMAEIRRYVVLDDAVADAVALWVVAVHAFDQFPIFPRLFITAPEKGCGKTTLVDVIGRMVPRKLSADSITAAALFRTVEAARPTLLLDEADTYMRDREDLRGVIDSGHRRNGTVIRTVGNDHEPRQFSTWAPAALAAIGHLPGTIEDRSVTIRLRRRRPDEPVEMLRLDRAGKFEELARMAARWAKDHGEALAMADPEMPTGIYNRAADNWRPLLSVSDIAAGAWPERARKATVELSSDGEDGMSAGVMLLGDLRELFDRQASAVLFTREILAALHKDENRPWVEWKNGRPITERQLAAMLKPHRIKPKTVRRGGHTDKGYRIEWFEDAFASYLLPRSVTASQSSVSAGFEPMRSVTSPAAATPDVTDLAPENVSISACCDAVTDEIPLAWRERV